MQTQITPIKIATIEVLLAKRIPRRLGEHCGETDAIALAVSGLASDDVVITASAHLAGCERCREAVLMMPRDESSMFPWQSSESPAQPEEQTNRRGLTRTAWSLMAAAVLLGISVLIFTALDNHSSDVDSSDTLSVEQQKQSAGHRGRLVPKGASSDDFIVALRRGAKVSVASDGLNHIETGDQLGMFYSAFQPGYLIVVNLDENDHFSLLYPVGQRASASISKGNKVSLPDGVKVNSGSGCEWIVAFFSEGPLRVESVERAVRRAQKERVQCEFEVDMPMARTVKIVTFTR